MPWWTDLIIGLSGAAAGAAGATAGGAALDGRRQRRRLRAASRLLYEEVFGALQTVHAERNSPGLVFPSVGPGERIPEGVDLDEYLDQLEKESADEVADTSAVGVAGEEPFEDRVWRDQREVFAALTDAREYQLLLDVYFRARDLASWPLPEDDEWLGPRRPGATRPYRHDRIPEVVDLHEQALRMLGRWAGFSAERVDGDLARAAR